MPFLLQYHYLKRKEKKIVFADFVFLFLKKKKKRSEIEIITL